MIDRDRHFFSKTEIQNASFPYSTVKTKDGWLFASEGGLFTFHRFCCFLTTLILKGIFWFLRSILKSIPRKNKLMVVSFQTSRPTHATVLRKYFPHELLLTWPHLDRLKWIFKKMGVSKGNERRERKRRAHFYGMTWTRKERGSFIKWLVAATISELCVGRRSV